MKKEKCIQSGESIFVIPKRVQKNIFNHEREVKPRCQMKRWERPIAFIVDRVHLAWHLSRLTQATEFPHFVCFLLNLSFVS